MSEQPNGGGPAFAVNNESGCHPGMSLRDYFAGQALIALTAGQPIVDDDAHWCHPLIAVDAYKLADAMIAARNERPQP